MTTSVTVFSRASDYKNEGMYVFEKTKLMCGYCQKPIDWTRKSVIDNHVDSDKHKGNKERKLAEKNNKRQVSIAESISNAKKLKQDREEFIKSTVRAFLNANIPLEKLDKTEFRQWLNKYVPGSGDLPNAQQLREKYIPLLKDDYDDILKSKLKGNKIIVLCDETTNRLGQAVFLVLFKILPSKENPTPNLFVASVKILQNTNADECSKAFLQTIQHFEVAHQDVVAIGSDSAAYMNLCIRLLKTLLDNPSLIHLQCWAHKLDKIVKIFPEQLYSFTNAKEIKLFPLPVMTRWGTWKKSAVYIADYAEDIADYVCKELTGKSYDSQAVKYFRKLKPEDIMIIKAEAKFVVEYCSPVCDLQLMVEGSKYPMSHLLYAKVSEIRKPFSSVANAGDSIQGVLFDKTKDSVALVPHTKQKTLLGRIKKVCEACNDLIKSQLKEDTASEFFEASNILFNPCKLSASLSSEKIVKAKESIAILNCIPTANFVILHSLLSDHVKENNANASHSKKGGSREDVVVNALMSMMQDHPIFAVSCLQVLHVSVSNVDSERGFSAYGDIFTPKRTNLTKDKVEAMMCMYFSSGMIDLNNNNATDYSESDGVVASGSGPPSVYFNDTEDMFCDDL
ncbi:hypothetical protein FOCC_FOCC014942 [Frankliniella occidentalis]|nr:hypothetical protein FOCC_FOCC014942 [Frankliniella occidentalis]